LTMNDQPNRPHTSPFDAIRHVDDQLGEFWSARELYVVEQHLAECDTCTQELSRSTTTKERLDARGREDQPLTADEVHRIVSQRKVSQ